MKFGRKPDLMIPKYQLSNAAKQDLINIAKYADKQFGITQSDHYRNRLKHRFTLISNHYRKDFGYARY